MHFHLQLVSSLDSKSIIGYGAFFLIKTAARDGRSAACLAGCSRHRTKSTKSALGESRGHIGIYMTCALPISREPGSSPNATLSTGVSALFAALRRRPLMSDHPLALYLYDLRQPKPAGLVLLTRCLQDVKDPAFLSTMHPSVVAGAMQPRWYTDTYRGCFSTPRTSQC